MGDLLVFTTKLVREYAVCRGKHKALAEWANDAK